MSTYQHQFSVRASLSEVARFHNQPRGVAALTPPPVVVKVHRAPECVEEEAQMDFTMWFGPLPVQWRAIFEQVNANGFVDRQLKGPFRTWVHRHSYLPKNSPEIPGSNETTIRDEITIELKRHLFWGPFGWLMRLSLPLLFGYRTWKTRRLLERGQPR